MSFEEIISMKYKFLLLSVFSLFILFCLVTIKIKENANVSVERIKNDSFLLNCLYENLNKQFKSNNSFIKNETSLVDISGNTIYLRDIVGKMKFVIRFRGTQCRSCVNVFNQYTERLKKIISDLGADLVIILLDSENITDLQIVTEKMNCEVYGIPVGNLSLELENKNHIIPFYLFTLSNFLMIQDCFIPVDNLDDLLDVYIESIERKYLILDDKSF